jgi:hypothetical protein
MSATSNPTLLSSSRKLAPTTNTNVRTVTMPNGSKAAGFYAPARTVTMPDGSKVALVSVATWIESNRKRKYDASIADYETLVADYHTCTTAQYLIRFGQVSMKVARTYLAWRYPSVPKQWLTDNASTVGVGCLIPGGQLENAISTNIVHDFPTVAAK